MQNKTRNVLEIIIKNPIGYDEIAYLKSQIMIAKNFSFLIIDTGKHDFVSINIIKHFRAQMQSLEPQLLEFEKIALIHPPEYRNESTNPELYDYFTSIIDAKKWFLK